MDKKTAAVAGAVIIGGIAAGALIYSQKAKAQAAASAPQITLSGPSSAQVGQTVIFTASTNLPDGTLLYLWSNYEGTGWSVVDQATVSGGQAQFSLTFGQAGTYELTASNQGSTPPEVS